MKQWVAGLVMCGAMGAMGWGAGAGGNTADGMEQLESLLRAR